MTSPAHTRYSQPVLTKRGHISTDEATRFIRETLRDVRAYMHEHDLSPAGPPFAITSGADDPGMVNVEAGWPLDHEAVGAGAIHSATLPRTLARHNASRRVVA
jgi:hypothetical protein